MPAPEGIRPYLFHGVQLNWNDRQGRGCCPYCRKEDHFYVDCPTGKYSCKRCHEEGNLYIFLQKVLEYSPTSQQQYEELSSQRGISVRTMQRNQLFVHFLTGQWTIPIWNVAGKLSNLMQWVQTPKRMELHGTPTCKQHPYLGNQLTHLHTTLWLTEGHWDALLWDQVLRLIPSPDRSLGANLRAFQGVLGLPGHFQRDWLALLAHRHVKLLLDNDPPKEVNGRIIRPGHDLTQRVIKMAAELELGPLSVQAIAWRDGDPKDIRDLVKEN